MTTPLSWPASLLVREHDTLVRGNVTRTGDRNVHTLAADAFDALLVLVTSSDVPESRLNPVATPTKFGLQDALKLSQWVGLIRTPDGTTVEILPKTHERPGDRAAEGSLERSRGLLLRMLQVTHKDFRVAPPADLDTAQMPLLEVFLRFALEGIRVAVRRGVPHAYVTVQEERPGLRGRLDLSRQVRQPDHRAHLLHVEYDEFLPDRPETRLTRLSVERILSLSRQDDTRRLARQVLHALDRVPPSRDIRRDFDAWRLERGNVHFAPLESLCRMVLYNLNPLVGGAATPAHALLFDMNKVYEDYVAQLLREQAPTWGVTTQDRLRSLGTVGGRRAFPVRPDLLITTGTQVVVADTKWKRLNPAHAPTYDVNNADAYQMLAYSEVFQATQAAKELWLIYPALPGLPAIIPPIELVGGRLLRLLTLDLQTPAPRLKLPDFQPEAPLLSSELISSGS